jgi:hypothetical protein
MSRQRSHGGAIHVGHRGFGGLKASGWAKFSDAVAMLFPSVSRGSPDITRVSDGFCRQADLPWLQ